MIQVKNKELALAILYVAFAAAFVFVSAFVTISKGKSAFWTDKKMQIGGILLSINLFFNSCNSKDEVIPVVTCYDPIAPNEFYLDSSKYYNGAYQSISIDLNTSNKITGIVYAPDDSNYSFSITDTLNNSTFQNSEVIPSDGKFDDETESFYLEIDKTLTSDKYYLNLFKGASTEQDQNYALRIYILDIKNEK